jgi:NAD(P)-dependent dehydrogenase (short-subunit alcohol dehydrogenase family)
MRERGYGRIVNVASSAGLQGYAYSAAYCAAKHALVGYTRAAAVELARSGVRVAAVCPHYVDTPMLDASVQRVSRKTGREPAGVREFFREQNPGRRFVTAEEVAEAVWRLLTDEAAPLLLELDGGEAIARS